MAYPNKSKTSSVTHEQIVRDVRAGNIKPVYFLMGEESYYIDHLADFLVGAILKPEERDFALITTFGADTNVANIVATAQAFPMGAQRQVVLVKEAQALKHLERLEAYLNHIQPTTVLIFCYKNGTLDRRLKVASLISKVGVLYESKKLYDRDLPPFIKSYLQRKHTAAEPGVGEMMAEAVGPDLNRMASELDKLILSLPNGSHLVTVDMVRERIGVSRNFNVFELQDALVNKDVARVNRIVKYFDDNPKENPIQMVLPFLFKYFTNLLLAFYSPDMTEHGIAQWLGLADWQARRNVLPAMRLYKGMKVVYILSEIRRADARSKGVGNPAISNGELMKELMFFILH